jgi:hypothetical protein
MDIPLKCPACGADQSDGKTCEDHFHQMLFWENEYPDYTWPVHHLMVASYYIQHPHLYSPDGLTFSINLLKEFLSGVDPRQKAKDMRPGVQSDIRNFKIKGTPDSHGSYPVAVPWTMFAHDVTAQPVEQYADAIWAWARSIYHALQSVNQAS